MSLAVTRLGHKGEGIADGPVYVARALPGEMVDGDVIDGRIASPRFLMPSPDRVRAPCPHYKACGGCALMHASDDFVANWKREVVVRALQAQGIDALVDGPDTSPPRSRRRAVLSARRLKSGVVVGFHGRASGTIVPIPECHLLLPQLMAAIPACARIVGLLGSRKGEMKFILTASDAGVDLSFEGGRTVGGPERLELTGLAEKTDLARLSTGDDVIVERRVPVHVFGTVNVVPPPGAFLQATPEGETALVTAVHAAVGSARRIADLFAGCGTFGLALASGSEVHAVENSREMLDALDRGWRQGAGLKPVTTETRDLFRQPLLAGELARFDAVVIDPPRAGAEAQMRELAQSEVGRIAAVSCNPATFARDARILIDAGYRLETVRVVDQFRWSAHVELAAAFVRGHMPDGNESRGR